tara:strand:- start:164 stop:760 length:597 start_codon:yes stop_codon:yes gene_type:complete
MKKELGRGKDVNEAIWEDYILKNNVKRKSNRNATKINDFKLKESFKKYQITFAHDPTVSNKPVLKNSMQEKLLNSSFPKMDVDIEKNKLRRIKIGKINIEGSIDLHGLSLKEAEKQLQVFVGKSFRLKKRFLLVITGKGRNSKPSVHGNIQTIKTNINKWLSDDFYRDKIHYVSKALDKHGGGGAYYFFLRQSKNVLS